MNAEQTKKWETARNKGFVHYVLVDGLLLFATLSFALCFLMLWMLGELDPWIRIFDWPKWVLLWFASGVGWATAMWLWGQWYYARFLRRK